MMTTKQFHRTSLLALGAALLGATLPAHATLGGTVETVQADAVKTHATLKVKTEKSGTYTVHEMTLPGGTVVRQFASRNGLIFGVAWVGPHVPNLHTLLGNSFATLSDHEAKARPGQRSGLRVEEDGLFIETRGHMGSFAGSAFLRHELPAGVLPAVVQ